MEEIVGAPPTAELRPLAGGEETEEGREEASASNADRTDESGGGGNSNGAISSKSGTVVQTDEDDMGMTYSELRLFGLLRKGT